MANNETSFEFFTSCKACFKGDYCHLGDPHGGYAVIEQVKQIGFAPGKDPEEQVLLLSVLGNCSLADQTVRVDQVVDPEAGYVTLARALKKSVDIILPI